MVGIVIVSHSARIAEGVAELAREMGGDDVALETAGGLEPVEGPDGPVHPIGTDAVLVMQAIERAWSDDGVLVLMDLGSAVLSAEMALELLGDDRTARILLCEAPLVEGAVAAAVTARLGQPLETVAREARAGLAGKVTHLGAAPDGPGASGADDPAGAGSPGDASGARQPSDAAGSSATIVITVDLPHGLHARPAARFVQTVSGFAASVRVRNSTTGAGPADGTSLNGVATLGVTSGHDLEVTASGPQAGQVVEAVRVLAARRFDEPASVMAARPSMDGSATGRAEIVDGTLAGFPASPGVAIGPARRFRVPELIVPEPAAPPDPTVERTVLEDALRETRTVVSSQQDEVTARASDDEARIFDAHLLFLDDEALLGPARDAIERGTTAAAAWRGAVDQVASTWNALDDRYLRERAVDLRSVGTQVLAHILGVDVPAPRLSSPGVLVAADLAPADTAGLDPTVALGIVTEHGGPTSHAAVLARAMGIPAVVGVGAGARSIADDATIGIDGSTGVVHVDPAPDVRAGLEAARTARLGSIALAASRAAEPAITIDGAVIEVAANIGTPGEVAAAVAAGADGIGLFRTEFLFMDRDTLPDEHEQEAAYRTAAEALDGRPLLVRTLDAGADKPVRALGQSPEPNPFLGVRGVRVGLDRPSLLGTQLRALVRVAAAHPVRVMFPMVATVDELTQARRALDAARVETGIDARLEVGVMVEVPSAALTARAIARHADFFSIGTNDLTQYAMAADRGNERVASLNDPMHPAVLMLIAAAVEGARAESRWVGVCGELAGDPAATALLLGLGVRELSMAAPAIAEVKEAVRATELTGSGRLAARALAAASATDVRALLA